VSESDFRHFIFENFTKSYYNQQFQNIFNASTKMYYVVFGGIWFCTQGFALVKQVLYFSHTSSSHLGKELDFGESSLLAAL
jgi:hypothetical protein